MKTLHLLETATQYTTTRNKYGDLELTSIGTIQCLYRNNARLNRLPTREEVAIEGTFWFAANATVKLGDVIGYSGQLYRIEDVVVAKQLVTSNQIHFIKCMVSLYRAIS